MMICEACGCPVDPEFLEIHSDWHDDLIKRSELADQSRTIRAGEIIITDC